MSLMVRTIQCICMGTASIYVVGKGFGIFDKEKDPLSYNLVDPPYENTIYGWAAIRFKCRSIISSHHIYCK
jgi:hypothetical protein